MWPTSPYDVAHDHDDIVGVCPRPIDARPSQQLVLHVANVYGRDTARFSALLVCMARQPIHLQIL